MKDEDDEFRRELAASRELDNQSEMALGKRNWALLRSYGRVMSGPYSGMYVSGLPLGEAQHLVTELVKGRTIEVHLMHKHRSGEYLSSCLRFADGQLVMRYTDHDEAA